MFVDGFKIDLYTSWASLLSLGFISFVAILFAVKLFIKIRSRFNILVNCWFCNQNTRVQYESYNSWDCPNCGQYNGFTKDGDYNREINKLHIQNNVQFNHQISPKRDIKEVGLCQRCNENQLTKVEKLANFEPHSDKTFNEDLKSFRESLEDTYRLCHRCEKTVRKVLADKKKMVLGLHLAHKGATKVFNQTKKFIKPFHIRTSTSIKILQRLTNSILLILAITNWLNLINKSKLKRDNFLIIFDPITTSILFFILSHLATVTKVMIKYLSGLFKIHLVEKTLLFIRTIIMLAAYGFGFDFYENFKYFANATVHSGIPFVCMFLAFGSHFWEGFKVTKKTYLLALWSAYSYMPSEDILPNYAVFKILISSLLLIISLPTLRKQNELQQILNTTVNSFHHIQTDDYVPENKDNIVNKSKSINNSLNLSTSSYSSTGSFSPISLASKNNLTSSAFNLCTTPMSAFKTYSNEQLHNKSNECLNESFASSAASKTFTNQVLNKSFNQTPVGMRSPLHVDASMNTSFGVSTPKSFISCMSSFTPRRNLVSPSHFTNPNISVYSAAYATPALSPCPSSNGFYYNCDDKLEKQKNYIFSNVIPHENISRGSSQSSGFESITGSTMYPPSERFYTYEKSLGHHEDSIYSAQFPSLDNHETMMYNNHFKGPPHSPCMPRNNIFQSKSMDFENGDHWIRNTPKSNRRQTFNADLLPQANLSQMQRSNAFDLNGMNSYLPPVRKRYNLLGTLNESVMKSGLEKELDKVGF